MKKFLAYICFIVAVVSLYSFFFFLNAGQVLLKSDTLKGIVSDSGIYENITGYLQEQITIEVGSQGVSNVAISQLESLINPQVVRDITESSIDQINNSNTSAVKIELPNIEVRDNELVQTTKELTLDNTIGSLIWSNISLATWSMFGLALIFVIFILLLSPNWTSRATWVGSLCIVTTILLSASYGVLLVFARSLPEFLMKGSEYLSDPKLMTSVSKLFDSIWNYQQKYYLTEIILLFLSSIVLFVIGGIGGKKQTELVLPNLDKAKTDISNLPKKGLKTS